MEASEAQREAANKNSARLSEGLAAARLELTASRHQLTLEIDKRNAALSQATTLEEEAAGTAAALADREALVLPWACWCLE